MNEARRKNIQEVANQLEELKAALGDIQGKEEACRDSIPENLQDSERYETSYAACRTLDDAVNALEDVISSLDELAEE